MNVSIPVELEEFVQAVIERGTYQSEAEVVSEALRLLKKREQLRQAVRGGVEQLDRGEYSEYDENSLPEFLADVEARQRERFLQKSEGR